MRVLECLAPWLCISTTRPVGTVGSAARNGHHQHQQQQQQRDQQQPQNQQPDQGWVRDSQTPARDQPTQAHTPPTTITATMVKTFQVSYSRHDGLALILTL